jgi:hypothetical protein
LFHEELIVSRWSRIIEKFSTVASKIDVREIGRCGNEFCYGCGLQWGAGHSGCTI